MATPASERAKIAFVRPTLEFASSVRDPHTQKDITRAWHSMLNGGRIGLAHTEKTPSDLQALQAIQNPQPQLESRQDQEEGGELDSHEKALAQKNDQEQVVLG